MRSGFLRRGKLSVSIAGYQRGKEAPPKGLLGLVCWYALCPIHSMIFGGMIQELARRAIEIAANAKT